MNAQLIIYLDKSGNFHAELPGQNGARVKVDLGENFRERNPEIAVALVEKQAELARQQERIQEEIAAKHNAKSQGEKLAELNAEKTARFEAWLDTLPKERREVELAKKQARDEKAAQFLASRARELWSYTASAHDIGLANRVVPDSQRRPAKRVIVYGQNGTMKLLNPRTGEATSGKTKSRNVEILDL